MNSSLIERKKLSPTTFALVLKKPEGFTFEPGQKITLIHEGIEREYSLITSPEQEHLGLCIRNVEQGVLTPILAELPMGTPLRISDAYGYFTFKPSQRMPVFVAGGTGIAPFCSMTAAHTMDFILCHGVRAVEELYYRDFFASHAQQYIACISQETINTLEQESSSPLFIQGRVTEYLQHHLDRQQRYDFYICGQSELVRDTTALIDATFPDSLVYIENFT